MKKRICILSFLLIGVSFYVNAQTVFWTETFSPGWPNGAWNYNVSTGANSASCNLWYVSCQEDGHLAGVCGTGCSTGDPSLHVGSQSLGDMGAAYDASQITNRRTESPIISTIPAGSNTITLSFTTIGFGQAGVDYCQLLYSINGGTSWLTLASPLPQSPCCGGACSGQNQGQWTARSYALPVSCNSIANLKIAFNWINNGAAGTDPSFAVDNITLRYTAPLPVSWLSFEGYRSNNYVFLNWKTASETNNDYFEIQRSIDGVTFSAIGKVKGNGNSNEIKSFAYTDKNSYFGDAFYRIKQVDYDGAFLYSKTISVSNDEYINEGFGLQTSFVLSTLNANISSSNQNSCFIEIKDVLGKTISSQLLNVSKGDNSFQFNLSSYKSGVYFFILKDKSNLKVLLSNKFVKL